MTNKKHKRRYCLIGLVAWRRLVFLFVIFNGHNFAKTNTKQTPVFMLVQPVIVDSDNLFPAELLEEVKAATAPADAVGTPAPAAPVVAPAAPAPAAAAPAAPAAAPVVDPAAPTVDIVEDETIVDYQDEPAAPAPAEVFSQLAAAMGLPETAAAAETARDFADKVKEHYQALVMEATNPRLRQIDNLLALEPEEKVRRYLQENQGKNGVLMMTEQDIEDRITSLTDQGLLDKQAGLIDQHHKEERGKIVQSLQEAQLKEKQDAQKKLEDVTGNLMSVEIDGVKLGPNAQKAVERFIRSGDFAAELMKPENLAKFAAMLHPVGKDLKARAEDLLLKRGKSAVIRKNEGVQPNIGTGGVMQLPEIKLDDSEIERLIEE